ncbi:MAG TPA: dihydroneopterin aldolase [Candidatus Caenarcaniphilales bacterium]|nr:dihydroneopterin aldolase [Candidatus Caenarcaniphilales bacterium]
MTDRIYLHGMIFEGRHGVTDEERELPQQMEVDVDLTVDLRAAGESDDVARTVDYADVFEVCRRVVEEQSFHLLERIGEALVGGILGGFPAVDRVAVDVKKSGPPLAGMLEHAGVHIERTRTGAA